MPACGVREGAPLSGHNPIFFPSLFFFFFKCQLVEYEKELAVLANAFTYPPRPVRSNWLTLLAAAVCIRMLTYADVC
jgi:hypothetical protein